MSVIKGGLLLVTLVSFTIASSFYSQNLQVRLEGGRYNIVNLACTPSLRNGRFTVDEYVYKYSGLPRWLQANGNQLYGTVPAYERGPWFVDVTYWSTEDPSRKGSARLALELKEVAVPVYRYTPPAVLPETPKIKVVPISTKPVEVPKSTAVPISTKPVEAQKKPVTPAIVAPTTSTIKSTPVTPANVKPIAVPVSPRPTTPPVLPPVAIILPKKESTTTTTTTTTVSKPTAPVITPQLVKPTPIIKVVPETKPVIVKVVTETKSTTDIKAVTEPKAA